MQERSQAQQIRVVAEDCNRGHAGPACPVRPSRNEDLTQKCGCQRSALSGGGELSDPPQLLRLVQPAVEMLAELRLKPWVRHRRQVQAPRWVDVPCGGLREQPVHDCCANVVRRHFYASLGEPDGVGSDEIIG